MCGIFAYIGTGDSATICLKGLKALEYRGYDSAGIAGLYQGKIHFKKEVGNISILETSVKSSLLQLDLAIAHTRWATHGTASKENAHPHFDQGETVAVVHNGIIENYYPLRKELELKGVHFKSETDSEIIAQLIAYHYRGDFVEAFQKTLKQIKGLWGIAAIHQNHPDVIITASNESPIAVAYDKQNKQSYISSDANAFQEGMLDVAFLENNEMAVVSKEGFTVYNHEAKEVIKKLQQLAQNRELITKGGYAHFMLKEIFEQPQTLLQTMKGRVDLAQTTAKFKELTFSEDELLAIEKIILVGCGTSWHAAMTAALLLEEFTGLDARAEIASEFTYRSLPSLKNTLVIVISQSGETMDTLCALREAKHKGAKVLGVCNVENSTIARDSDSCLFLQAGPEISVCSTKAYSSQITVLTLFALYLGRLRKVLSVKDAKAILEELLRLPELVNLVLNQHEKIQAFAKKYRNFKSFFFLGRNLMYVTAEESALKLKEISYINANAYPSGEMKHGPIALVDSQLATIGLLGNSKTAEKTLSNLMEIKARKGPILVFAPKGIEELVGLTPDIVIMPKVTDALAPIPYAVAGQLFAYYIALDLGTDIDKPRNLAKSLTVE